MRSCAQPCWRPGGHEGRAEVLSGWAHLTCPRSLPLQESPASFGILSTVSSVGFSLVLFHLCIVLCWCSSCLMSMRWRPGGLGDHGQHKSSAWQARDHVSGGGMGGVGPPPAPLLRVSRGGPRGAHPVRSPFG